ncbi:putative O-glycosylation ligase (exosortase A-associated) [Desulfosalsimonas propionicica]|uniref:Putative O-glycosylation ligase (Exosortase A-associated) n=1 Tax=Desulfosalsimonas propionicica TaxID=332175 RepID=A0A7W0HME9_9BACT|nr:O-antigen ligase family protein [Desulfosalsimonas propionicica]MBA2883011.1 putative O-glycosylation ligase (exosortase A-associated) [Desulfosalsimonas propionicica]
MTVSTIDLYKLRPGKIWRAFATEGFAFWMSCLYLFFEYVRPQAIWEGLDAYPYWARTFVILAFIGWLFDTKRQFVWTKITTGVCAFMFLIAMSSFTAYWPATSWENFMKSFNWVVIFFVLTQTVTTRQRFYIMLLIFFLASFKLSQHGAIVFAKRGFSFASWGIRGPQGFFENPGELAIQMVVFAPIALFFIQGIREHLKRWQVYALYLMPVTAALTTLGTNTRGGQLALAAQVLALISVTKHRFKMLLAVALIAIIGFQLLPPEQKERFENIGKDSTSIQRLLYWENGWQMMKDHPLLGVGYFNFIPYYNRYYPEDLVLSYRRGKGAELPHNIIIQVGTDTGFAGLAVYMGLIAAAFFRMRRIGKEAEKAGDTFISNLCKGMNLSLLGFFVAGQFVTVAYYPYLWIHLVFVTAIYTFWQKEKAEQQANVGREALS